MTRELSAHKVNGLNEAIRIEVLDEPGSGNANHVYRLTAGEDVTAPQTEIVFQNGPVGTCGVNGLSNEALVAVVIDRLQGFQKGPFACRENALALTKLEEATHWLHQRTRERLARGVEGTNLKQITCDGNAG